ncbi:MAG: alpha-ketoacid dehydrogenase subunit beta [Chloroflexota bacterium]
MRSLSFREAIRDALRECMLRDSTVFLLGEDIGPYNGAFKVTEGLWEEFGAERVMDTPISEAAIVGAGVGAAIMGLRPVCEIMYLDMTTVAIDQLVNNAAKMRYAFGGQVSVPMVVRTAFGGGGHEGMWFSQSLEAWFVHVPGLKVVMPSTPYDAKGLMKAAIKDPNPVLFLEHKMLYARKGPVPDDDYEVPLGVGEVKREGADVTLVATGAMVHKALSVATKLADRGISVEVIDPRTLSPLDKEVIVSSVKKTGRLVVAHEACKVGGFGAEIAAIAAKEAFSRLDAPIERVGAPFTPVPFSPALEQAFIPQESDIEAAVLTTLGR